MTTKQVIDGHCRPVGSTHRPGDRVRVIGESRAYILASYGGRDADWLAFAALSADEERALAEELFPRMAVGILVNESELVGGFERV